MKTLKAKIKKGDTVVVTTGNSRGKKGTVVKVDVKNSMVVVEGVKVRTVMKRPNVKGAKAQPVEVAQPIHISNVMVVDAKTGKPSRVAFKTISGKKVRVTSKSGSEIK